MTYTETGMDVVKMALDSEGVIILPPQDVMVTLQSIKEPVTTTILDPWYNKGVGGVRGDYKEWLVSVLAATLNPCPLLGLINPQSVNTAIATKNPIVINDSIGIFN